jgi:hypothetical protein
VREAGEAARGKRGGGGASPIGVGYTLLRWWVDKCGGERSLGWRWLATGSGDLCDRGVGDEAAVLSAMEDTDVD